MTVAHHVEGGAVYRATLEGDRVTFAVRDAGDPYTEIGSATWDGARIIGAVKDDERVCIMMRAFEAAFADDGVRFPRTRPRGQLREVAP